MHRYICLLRGINVGGRIIKKDELGDCFVELGLSNVQVILQSGNIVFASNEADPLTLKASIERSISARFNFESKAFVLSSSKARDIRVKYPFELEDQTFQYYVLFMEDDLAEKLYELSHNLSSDIDEVRLGDDVVYWKVKRGKTVLSPFSKLLLKAEFKNHHTNRNIRTIDKLLSFLKP